MKLELYHFDECPYCAKVRKFIDQADLREKIEYRNIYKDSSAMETLLSINNDDDQVPCLVIDGKPMLESDEIITFLKKTFNK